MDLKNTPEKNYQLTKVLKLLCYLRFLF